MHRHENDNGPRDPLVHVGDDMLGAFRKGPERSRNKRTKEAQGLVIGPPGGEAEDDFAGEQPVQDVVNGL